MRPEGGRFIVDNRLRSLKAVLLAPAVRITARVSPLILTAASFGTGLAVAVLIVSDRPAAALTCWLISRVFDGLDGEVARYGNKQSDLGGYLDIMGDITVYAVILIALTASVSPGPWGALAVLLATFYVNIGSWMYLAAVLEKRKAEQPARELYSTSIEMPGGLVEGTESVVFIAVALLFRSHLPLLFGVFSLMTAITIAQRVRWAWNSI